MSDDVVYSEYKKFHTNSTIIPLGEAAEHQ